MEFDSDQTTAIQACCDTSRRVVAITGGAGTGKTRIIKEVYEALCNAGYKVACSAPTGKAAKRITESTGLPAQTNHRLLGYGMPLETEQKNDKGERILVKLSTGPRFSRRDPLPYDVILSDEYAMVNQEINRSLIDALPRGGRLCMFGDVNQLKPIEESKMLQEQPSAFKTALEKFEGITLNTNHRQTEGSGIADNCQRILRGSVPVRRDDFDIIYTDDPVQRLLAYIDSQRSSGVADYSSSEYQVITCMNKSWIGTKRLNLSIQSLFWDRARDYMELPRHPVWNRTTQARTNEDTPIRVQVGSKVVYTANTYDLGNEQSIFNGEVGNVVSIDSSDGSLDIDLGDRVVTISPIAIVVKDDGRVIETDPRRNIDLAYALTTHKMQGSEVKHVTYVINKSTYYGQSRANFYTAMSRAREYATVMTDYGSIQKSVKYQGA